MNKGTSAAIGISCALALALSACSSKASGGSDSGGSGDLQTDVGVTDTEITIGALTDTSGPFKVGGLAVTHGNEIWVNEVNAAGGICDRQIKLDLRDTGYKPDTAIAMYEQVKGTSVGIVQIIGSAVFAALKARMVNDKLMGSSPTIASVNLDTDIMVTVGTTFDIEMINGMAYLQNEGLIADGDKVGLIYIQNEAGENGALGVKAYAEEHDLTLVEAPISATDTDVTSTVTKFKSEGVAAVAIAITPGALASVAVQTQGQGLNVPIYGWNPAFQPSVLSDESVVAATQGRLYISGTNVTWNSDIPAAQDLRDAYAAGGFTDPPTQSTTTGYLSGVAWGAILEQACEDGDMTRDGLMAARKKVTSLDTNGLTGTLDFSDPGAPVTRVTIMTQTDPAVPGGLVEVSELEASQEAEDYQAPYQS